MTRRQIDASRELRLWIGQVIVPTIVGGATICTLYPEIPRKVKTKYQELKESIKSSNKES